MSEFRPGRFEILPPVIKNLIIINCLMALLQFVLLKWVNISDYLALHYWRSPDYKPWQWFTYMFMHGSPYSVDGTITHLFFNMLSLWMFGSILENLWGAKRFIIFYLLCGLGGAACHWLALAAQFEPLNTAVHNYIANPALNNYLKFIQENSLSDIPAFAQLKAHWEGNPACTNCSQVSIDYARQYFSEVTSQGTVGASGAIFGVQFAFAYLFPNTLLYIYFLVPVKAKYLIAFITIAELYSGIQNSAGDNIAHFAHLGGMLIAFIILKIWNKKERRKFY